MSLEQWESYYRGGALATGPTGPDGSYDQEVRAAWEAFFGSLPHGARILDIGTGNGVIPLIASAVSQQRGSEFDIHGADLAQIDPPRDVPGAAARFAGIQFHPGVASEKLPFADASFDAVSGHYALEYSDTARALAEIHRVLKPGGDAQFIVHSDDSALVASARRSIAEAELALKQTRIYRRLHRLVTMEQVSVEATEKPTQELLAALRVVKQALAEARASGGGRTLAIVLDAVQKLLHARREGRIRPQLIGLEVDRAEKELRSGWRRLQDLVGHARSAQDMEALQAQAAAAGFSAIECQRQRHAGEVPVGWLLLLHKS